MVTTLLELPDDLTLLSASTALVIGAPWKSLSLLPLGLGRHAERSERSEHEVRDALTLRCAHGGRDRAERPLTR